MQVADLCLRLHRSPYVILQSITLKVFLLIVCFLRVVLYFFLTMVNVVAFYKTTTVPVRLSFVN